MLFPVTKKKGNSNNTKVLDNQKKSQFLIMAQSLRSPRAIRNFPVQVPTELHRALGQVALRLLVRRDEEKEKTLGMVDNVGPSASSGISKCIHVRIGHSG